jgi:hypothetical protein
VKIHSVLQGALGALASHRELIQEAYERGTIQRNADNARDVMTLHQYRILVADGPDEYHLSRALSRFLDDVTQRQRLYEYLGEGIAPLNERIYDLKTEFISAAREGKTDEMDAIAGYFCDACIDLADAISTSLSRLLVQAESRFGVAGSLTAKLRQNEHYLRQAEQISQALSALERSQDISWEIHEGDPLYEDLTGPYNRLVARRLGEWNAEVLRVTTILKNFLFRLRQIAPDVRRLRAFADFLHHNPAYEPPDFTDRRSLPSWLHCAPGMPLTSHPDIRDESMGPELEAIAQKLPAPKVIVSRVRIAGTLAQVTEEKTKVKISAPPEQKMLYRFVSAATVSSAPISARQWNRAEGRELGLADDLWMWLVIQARDTQATPFDKVVFRMVEYCGPAPISRNIFVKDIMVHGR